MPEEETVVQEEVKEEQEPTTNPVEMDEAALDALLNAPDEEEEGTPAEEAEPEGAEQQEEVKEGEEAKGEEEEKEPTPDEKKEKQLKDKEEFIQRQAAEIGELRKQAAALQEELSRFDVDENDALYQQNPTEAVNQVLAAREKQAEANRLEQQAAIKQSELLTKQNIPDFEDYLDDVTEILKEQKCEPEFIRSFKTNPYNMPPSVLVNLGTAAKLSKENKALKAEIEKLKKKPDEVLKNVEKAAKTVVTGSSGKAGKSAISEKQVHQMSVSELDDILNSPDD